MQDTQTAAMSNVCAVELSSLPLDSAMLYNILQQYSIKDLRVVVSGDKNGKEEKQIVEKTKEIGMSVKVKESEEKKVVIKMKQHMKYVVLKIQENITDAQ